MIDAWSILVRATWGGNPVPDPDPVSLQAALVLARRNEVEGALVRAYPVQLADELSVLEAAVAGYRRNLAEACALLDAVGVRPILIKALPGEDFTYSNFDLVVGDDGWEASVEALTPWAVRRSVYPLERRTKLLLYPPSGPAVHLHRSVAWFDVPVVTTRDLRAMAGQPDGSPCLLPGPVDRLRILLAHAAFQNQALSLGELWTVRSLAAVASTREAGRRAASEGWGEGFDRTWVAARAAMARLDAGERQRLPVPLPMPAGIATGLEHARHLVATGTPLLALRELVLLVPLLAAKRRAALRA